MPWSAGSFSRTDGTRNGSTVWAQAKAAAVKIISADHDTHDQDLATGINSCLNKNGENSPTANINWGGHKITNLANGSTSGDALHFGQIGSALQAYHANLAAVAALSLIADRLPYANGTGTLSLATFTSTGRSVVACASVSAVRTLLELGTAALGTIGTGNNQVATYDSTGYRAANGSQITNLNASNLASGTVPAARLPGATTSAVGALETATDAEALARAATDKILVPSNLAAAVGVGQVFESSEQAIAYSDDISVAHGLGSVPRMVLAVLRCKTTDLGYAVGDEVSMPVSRSGGDQATYTLFANSTNIGMAMGASDWAIPTKTGGAPAAIDSGDWRVVLRAWK